MKKVVLSFLLLLGVSDVVGIGNAPWVTVEKNNISVKYRVCTLCSVEKFGPTYYIIITNNSVHPIVVGPSLISAPLYTNYREIAKNTRERIKLLVKWFSGTTLALGFTTFMAWYLSKRIFGEEKKSSLETIPEWLLTLVATGAVGTGLGASSSAIGISFYLVAEKLIANVMLREPIIIQPGKSINKRFWLQNPEDPVKINFDTIKVLK